MQERKRRTRRLTTKCQGRIMTGLSDIDNAREKQVPVWPRPRRTGILLQSARAGHTV